MTTIAIITSHAPSLVHFRASLIESLRAKGVEVFALAPNYDAATRAAVLNLGATAVDCAMDRTGMNPAIDAWNTWQLTRLLRRLRPDITLGYFVKPVVFGTLAAWLAGVPRRFAMIEGLGFAFTPTAETRSIKRVLLKRLVTELYRIGLRQASRVIFLNPDDRSELINAGALSVKKSFLLGGIGVDLEKWPMSAPIVKPVTFLLVARLLREKGIEQYAAAARLIIKKNLQARFILLGSLDDNPGSITRNEVQKWVDDGILEWHGHVPVQPWLMQASVFVLPSYYREGVPASTQEAMAMGRPVITTDVPGCRDTVVNGVNGFLIPPRDVEALAEKMEIFIQRPDLIHTMGQASRGIAEERFNVHEVNGRLLDLILCDSVR